MKENGGLEGSYIAVIDDSVVSQVFQHDFLRCGEVTGCVCLKTKSANISKRWKEGAYASQLHRRQHEEETQNVYQVHVSLLKRSS